MRLIAFECVRHHRALNGLPVIYSGMLEKYIRIVGIQTPEGEHFGCVCLPPPAEPTVYFFEMDLRLALMLCDVSDIAIESKFRVARTLLPHHGR